MTADNTTRADGPTGQGQCRCNGRYEGCDHDPRRCDNPGGGHRSPFFCAECDPRRIEHIGPSGSVGQPDTAEPRSWSLPDPPPDDVTVVHVQAASGEVFRCVREGHRWRDGSGRDLFRLHRRRLFGFGELLDMGKVVEGEAPAVEPPVLADEAGGSR